MEAFLEHGDKHGLMKRREIPTEMRVARTVLMRSQMESGKLAAMEKG